MKALNFTAVEILPSLLDRSKTQTIRSAWKIMSVDKQLVSGQWESQAYEEKKPRFKVGDEIKIFWNQRSKHKKFCKICGKESNHFNHIYKTTFLNKKSKIILACINTKNMNSHENWFNKLLGTGKITEVFEIEMGLGKYKDREMYYIEYIGQEPESREYYNEPIAKLDGFQNADDMFFYFDNTYDLSNPKRFYVYRWQWK